MKRYLLLVVAIVFSAITPSRAGAAISVSVFYDSLEPYGEWLEVADYGYVWHPADIDEQWQPYTAGHWVFTDAGWTWMSDEPFGWAVYHYGRWARLASVGWVWVPETEWGPAWVSWRRSPKHVGWAPLPPEARFRQDVALSTWVDAYYDIGPTYYNFVEVRQFGAPHLREVLVPNRENLTIIHETRNITNITYTNNVIFNGGPEYDVIVRESAQPIRRLRLERVTQIDEHARDQRDAWRPRIEGDALRVVAPSVEVAADAVAPKKVARRIEKVEIDRGWKGIADQGQAQKFRTSMKSEAKAPPSLPPQPKFEPIAARKDEKAASESAPAPAVPTAKTESTAASPNATAPGKEANEQTAATTEKPLRTANRPGGKVGTEERPKASSDVGVDATAAAPGEDHKPASASPNNAKTSGKSRKDAAKSKATVSTPEGTHESDATATAPAPEAAVSPAAPGKDKQARRNAKSARNATAPDAELPVNSPAPAETRAKPESPKDHQPEHKPNETTAVGSAHAVKGGGPQSAAGPESHGDGQGKKKQEKDSQ